MKKEDSCLLVLTACVDPRSAPMKVWRSDPALRLKDYQQALRFWLALPDRRIQRIVFIENNGYPLDVFREQAARENPLGREIEFISLNCNDYPAHLSYGYAELEMLDLGLPLSRLARPDDVMIKVTGRLTFPGLPRLLDRLPDDLLFAVDGRLGHLLIQRHPKPRTVITQLFLVRLKFFMQDLRGINRRMKDYTDDAEATLCEALGGHAGSPGAIFRWPVNCDPQGHGAFRNRDQQSLRQKFLHTVRAALRVILPELWF